MCVGGVGGVGVVGGEKVAVAERAPLVLSENDVEYETEGKNGVIDNEPLILCMIH